MNRSILLLFSFFLLLNCGDKKRYHNDLTPFQKVEKEMARRSLEGLNSNLVQNILGSLSLIFLVLLTLIMIIDMLEK